MLKPLKSENNFQKIIKAIPFIYAVMVFESFTQIYLFYNRFDISIIPYISPFELLLYFIPYSALQYLPFAALALFALLLSLLAKNRNWLPYFSLRLIKQKSKIVNYLFLPLLVAGSVFLFCLNKYFCFQLQESFVKQSFSFHFALFVAIFLVACTSFYIVSLRAIYIFTGKLNNILYYNIICIILFVFTFSMIKSNYYINEFVVKGPNETATFDYLGKPVYTDATNRLLLGITKEYIFIQDKQDKNNEIYNLSDVKNLKVKRIY